MTEKEIRDLFASKGVALGPKDVWNVQSSLVIKHSALERMAAEIGVRWSDPVIIRADREEAVILAKGMLFGSDGTMSACEWSIGEALIGTNYRVSGKQAAYVYAMAEKRAKDRVILKLANLHGAYSEDEADEFRDAQPSGLPRDFKIHMTEPPAPAVPAVSASPARSRSPVETLIDAIQSAKTEYFLQAVITSVANIKTFEAASEDDQARISDAVQIRREDLTRTA